jgi:uncharacterized protein (DUF924 family)
MAQIPAKNILSYWFLELGPDKWFRSSAKVDEDIRTRFSGSYEEARKMAEKSLENLALETAEDYLATVILFDQFPHNMFRGLAQSFETDPLGLQLSHQAITKGFDISLPPEHRIFFYLPFEHSESVKDQELGVALVKERCQISNYLEYAEIHRDIIRHFGRFPHRNALLGRPSTRDEMDYLANGGKTFGAIPPKK